MLEGWTREESSHPGDRQVISPLVLKGLLDTCIGSG